MIADVLLDGPCAAKDEIKTYLCDAGALFWVPLPEGRMLVFGDVPGPHDGHAETPTLSDVRALLKERGPAGVGVHDPRWMTWFRTNYRLTPHYRHGRTFLAGDAAHIHSLVGGQGMNTGIQDAYNLGWKLALVSQRRAPESLLDSYEKERRAVAEGVLAMTRAMAERAYSYAGLSDAERDRQYRHAHIPEADRLRLTRHVEELDLDYRKSPICVEHRHSGVAEEPTSGLHAGAEAVDAGPLEVYGRQLTTFELIAGPHHTLLLFAGADGRGRHHATAVHLADEVARVYGDLVRVCMVLPADGEAAAFQDVPATVVRDLEGAMHDRYGARAGWSYLIRPDGYIGWCSDRPELTAFRDYLAKVLVSR